MPVAAQFTLCRSCRDGYRRLAEDPTVLQRCQCPGCCRRSEIERLERDAFTDDPELHDFRIAAITRLIEIAREAIAECN